MTPEPEHPSPIVDPQGQPARRHQDTSCPTCHAAAEKRRRSSGIGDWHDVCGVCGYEWLTERTAEA